MTKEELKSIIREVIQEQMVNESIDLDHLHDGVSTSTITGKSWFNFINSLSDILNEVDNWKGQYPSSLHGPAPMTETALQKLQQIVNICNEIKPIIIGMDQIEGKDI